MHTVVWHARSPDTAWRALALQEGLQATLTFESLQHATRLIGDWIHFYNHRRPHQALNMRTPAEAFAFAA